MHGSTGKHVLTCKLELSVSEKEVQYLSIRYKYLVTLGIDGD